MRDDAGPLGLCEASLGSRCTGTCRGPSPSRTACSLRATRPLSSTPSRRRPEVEVAAAESRSHPVLASATPDGATRSTSRADRQVARGRLRMSLLRPSWGKLASSAGRPGTCQPFRVAPSRRVGSGSTDFTWVGTWSYIHILCAPPQARLVAQGTGELQATVVNTASPGSTPDSQTRALRCGSPSVMPIGRWADLVRGQHPAGSRDARNECGQPERGSAEERLLDGSTCAGATTIMATGGDGTHAKNSSTTG